VGDKKQAVHVVYIFKTRLNQLEEHYTSKIHQQITPCRKKKKGVDHQATSVYVPISDMKITSQ
jgi:hypothetical protein